jgi:hypothetical protein
MTKAAPLPFRQRPDLAEFEAGITVAEPSGPSNHHSPRKGTMDQHTKEPKAEDQKSFLDYLLYLLAGSVFAVISFSFLLWLRF